MNTEKMKIEMRDAVPISAEVSVPELIKGEKGDTPIKYVDYFTPEDIKEIEKQLEIPDLSDYAKKADLPQKVSELENDKNYLVEETEPKYSADKPQIALKSELFSKDYNDLTNKPTIPSTSGLATETYVDEKVGSVSIPTKVSELENDKNYLTEHQSLEGYAKTADLATVATSGSYNDLSDKPDISGGASTASEVSFDDTIAQIGKNNVQEAIEYLVDEAVDSTSVQEQIDTNLYDIYGNSKYKNPQGNYYFFNPEEIYKITTDDGLDISSPLYMWRAAGLEPWTALNKVIIVKWERNSQFFDVDTIESRPRGCTLLKNHYYLLDLHRMPKGTMYDVQYWGERNDWQDNRNLSAKDTTKTTFFPRLIYGRLTGMDNDLGYCYIYDVTPYFQISEHEQKIAALEENSGSAEVDLSGYYTKEEVDAKGYLTEHQDISGKANSADLATVATSGSYEDLINLPSSVGNWIYTEDLSNPHIAEATALMVGVKLSATTSTSGTFLICCPEGEKIGDGKNYYFLDVPSGSNATPAKGYVYWNGSSLYGNKTINYVYYATNIDVGTIVDFSAYAKAADIPTKTSELTNDSGYLTEHQNLTEYAKKTELPTKVSQLTNDSGYLTAHQSLEGLATTTELTNAVSAHNTATEAHNDIRELIVGLTNRVNALADSDDTTLDQMSEIVAYIKANRTLIESVTTSKINVSDIIDNLTTNVSNKPLSAAQGVALKALIDAIVVPTKVSDLTNDSGYLTAHQSLAEYAKSANLSAVATSGSYADLADKPTIPSVEGLASQDWVEAKDYLTAHQSLADYAKKTELFSKDYNDLTNKPTIPSTSGLASEEWVEAKGYLTTHQSLEGYAKKTEIPTKVSQLTNDSGYLTEHQSLSAYAKSADLAAVAISGSYNDLTDKPTIPSTSGLATETYVNEKVAAAKPTAVTGTLAAGATSLVLSNAAITTNSTLDFYTDKYGVAPTNAVVEAGKVTLTFKAQSAALSVKVEVK